MILKKLFMVMKLRTHIGGLKILQVKIQKIGLKDRMNLHRNLLVIINFKNPFPYFFSSSWCNFVFETSPVWSPWTTSWTQALLPKCGQNLTHSTRIEWWFYKSGPIISFCRWLTRTIPNAVLFRKFSICCVQYFYNVGYCFATKISLSLQRVGWYHWSVRN